MEKKADGALKAEQNTRQKMKEAQRLWASHQK